MSRLQTNAIRHLGSAVDNIKVDSAGRVAMPNQPHARVARSAGNVGSSSVVLFNLVNENIGSMYDSGTGRFTAPVAGKYLIAGSFISAGNAMAYTTVRKNGVQIFSTHTSSTTLYGSQTVCQTVSLAAGDYIDFYIPSGSYVLYANAADQCNASVSLIG